MITAEQAEKANDWIMENAPKLAQAKANRIYLEEYRKTKKATLIQKTRGTVQEREAFAYGHPEYEQLLEGLKEAVAQEEELRWMMVAAQARIEIWRSQNASNRRVI